MAFARLPRPAASEPRAAPARHQAARAPMLAAPHHDISGVPIAGSVQRRSAPGLQQPAATAPPNRTGLPDGLKAGLETMSGLSMDAVRVHYGSAAPARIDALAYADGTDIHLGPGQERHLPHEAWHVVQQAEGRVRATTEVGGAAVNDDAGLEREADRMGAASAAQGRGMAAAGPRAPSAGPTAPLAAPAGGTVQGVFRIKAGDLEGQYKGLRSDAVNELIEKTREEIGGELGTGWVGDVREWAKTGQGPYSFEDTDAFYDKLRELYGKEEKEGKVRPNFSASAYKLAKIAYGLQTGKDEMDMKPSEEDLAMPHRFPFGGIKRSVEAFLDGSEDEDDLDRWSSRLEVANQKRLKVNLPKITKPIHKNFYKKEVEGQVTTLRKARANLKKAKKNGTKLTLLSTETQEFLKAANNMHGNIPDFGPHTKINIPVRDRIHIHVPIPDKWDFTTPVPPSPGSEQAMLMSPHRADVALDSSGSYVPTTTGDMFDYDKIIGFDDLMQYGTMHNTTIDSSKFPKY